MITEVVDPNLAAEKALTETLTKNMREMYNKGYVDGSVATLNNTSSNLFKVSEAKECPDELKAGFLEAAKYLAAVATGKPYELKAKPVEATGQAQAPQVQQDLPKADAINKLSKKANKSPVNPAHRN